MSISQTPHASAQAQALSAEKEHTLEKEPQAQKDPYANLPFPRDYLLGKDMIEISQRYQNREADIDKTIRLTTLTLGDDVLVHGKGVEAIKNAYLQNLREDPLNPSKKNDWYQELVSELEENPELASMENGFKGEIREKVGPHLAFKLTDFVEPDTKIMDQPTMVKTGLDYQTFNRYIGGDENNVNDSKKVEEFYKNLKEYRDQEVNGYSADSMITFNIKDFVEKYNYSVNPNSEYAKNEEKDALGIDGNSINNTLILVSKASELVPQHALDKEKDNANSNEQANGKQSQDPAKKDDGKTTQDIQTDADNAKDGDKEKGNGKDKPKDPATDNEQVNKASDNDKDKPQEKTEPQAQHAQSLHNPAMSFNSRHYRPQGGGGGVPQASFSGAIMAGYAATTDLLGKMVGAAGAIVTKPIGMAINTSKVVYQGKVRETLSAFANNPETVSKNVHANEQKAEIAKETMQKAESPTPSRVAGETAEATNKAGGSLKFEFENAKHKNQAAKSANDATKAQDAEQQNTAGEKMGHAHFSKLQSDTEKLRDKAEQKGPYAPEDQYKTLNESNNKTRRSVEDSDLAGKKKNALIEKAIGIGGMLIAAWNMVKNFVGNKLGLGASNSNESSKNNSSSPAP
ncbi:hypothetical protein ACFBZI_11425 [Moraxella sp. ZJ142]|uniref:hypothetical protein n=1 Tax=Moraxella marmotae TaxID=3344520 RepID=UPI0035D4E445